VTNSTAVTALKVRTSDAEEGIVSVENWADPHIHTLDVQFVNGDTTPMSKENLKYLDTLAS
jgi:hypothetical protein